MRKISGQLRRKRSRGQKKTKIHCWKGEILLYFSARNILSIAEKLAYNENSPPVTYSYAPR